MKTLVDILNFTAVISLILAGIGVVADYVLQFLAFFHALNMVEIGNTVWTVIFALLGISVCSFVLLHFIDR